MVIDKEATSVAVVVIEYPVCLEEGTHKRLREQFERALEGTHLEGVRVIVLEDGARVRAITTDGVT